MYSIGDLGSTVLLLLITYPLAVLLAWINGAPFYLWRRAARD
jgi:hypothetical protein